MPESPAGPESRALWEQLGESVILEGESDYDFNLGRHDRRTGHAQTGADSQLASERGPCPMQGPGSCTARTDRRAVSRETPLGTLSQSGSGKSEGGRRLFHVKQASLPIASMV